ncbi:MAG: hypothetical protein KF878_13435 [Planctomycetes bacterium]|nr:hypothetical protein [Planctomycetota bacterium]
MGRPWTSSSGGESGGGARAARPRTRCGTCAKASGPAGWTSCAWPWRPSAATRPPGPPSSGPRARRATSTTSPGARGGARAADDEARIRAAAALARAALGGSRPPAAERRAAERALSAADEWLRCPCPAHLGQALRDFSALAGRVAPPRTDDPLAALLRLAVAGLARRGLGGSGAAHLRHLWLPWLVSACVIDGCPATGGARGS